MRRALAALVGTGAVLLATSGCGQLTVCPARPLDPPLLAAERAALLQVLAERAGAHGSVSAGARVRF
ncbi:MAG: hypothetical protein KatS3mg102_2741 [Planctomycetota bacterium]|nr:MAG: hypothetical protein KatS3mg102_2741 [Planctomycetota bacterium]